MPTPNGSVTKMQRHPLDSRQASVIAALMVWLVAMPALFGLTVFFGFASAAAAYVCAAGALAALTSLALRPWWQSAQGGLAACVPFLALGAAGAMTSFHWASPAWAIIVAGFALGLALRAPIARLTTLSLIALLGALVVQAYWQPIGLGSEVWLVLGLAGGLLAAALAVIGFEPSQTTRKPTRLFLLDIAPADRLAVLGALEAAWAHGTARAQNLQAGPGGAHSLRVVRRNGALHVCWGDGVKVLAGPPPLASQTMGSAPFDEREIAELAHEIRTPLHQILGFAEVIEAQMLGPLDANYAEYAGLIGVSGRHLLDLTDSWLERARLQRGARILDTQDFDLHELASEAVRGFAQLAHLKEISLTLQGESCPVSADRRAWRQIAINLIGNALKFCPQRGTVRVMIGLQGQTALLEVEDSGPGIAPEDRARILRPFERAAGAAQQDGVGLGLSIVMALVRLHDGELDIGEASLGGARFRASAPIGRAADAVTGSVAGPIGSLQKDERGGEIARFEQ